MHFQNPFDPNSIEDALKKRMYALKELVSTEENYVQDLSYIVNGWVMGIYYLFNN